MTTNTGGPAFPAQVKFFDEPTTGMTLRDYFAAHAPEPYKNWHGGERGFADIIEWRWSYADAMLKAREV
jgi:hypothetical protein